MSSVRLVYGPNQACSCGLEQAWPSHAGPRPDPATRGLEIWWWSSCSVNCYHSLTIKFWTCEEQCGPGDMTPMARSGERDFLRSLRGLFSMISLKKKGEGVSIGYKREEGRGSIREHWDGIGQHDKWFQVTKLLLTTFVGKGKCQDLEDGNEAY